MIASTIKKLQSDIIPELTGCEQQWDYLYSKDAANAMYLLAEKGFHDATYCIGSGQVFPLRYYVEMIQNVTGSSTPLKIGAIPYAENQVMYLCADITTLTRDTGFIPQYSFQEGILEMIQTR
jgi:nucleoside-diphosphate-sugar epimerase